MPLLLIAISPELLVTLLSFAGAAVAGLLWKFILSGAKAAAIEAIATAVMAQIKPILDNITEDIHFVQLDVRYIKGNGIETSRRISNTEERVQQGAKELDAMRERFNAFFGDKH